MFRPETLERWRQRLERFESARMTVSQFCQNEGVSQAAFYKWRKALRDQKPLAVHQSGSPAPGEVRFLPLRLSPAAQNRLEFTTEQTEQTEREPVARPTAATTIELPGGVRIVVEVPMVSDSQRSGEVRP